MVARRILPLVREQAFYRRLVGRLRRRFYIGDDWRSGIVLWTKTPVGRWTSFVDWPGYVDPFADAPSPFGPARRERTRPATWASKRGLMLRLEVLFVLRDAWVGVYIPKKSANGSGGPLCDLYYAYIALVPFFPLRVTVGLPHAWGDLLCGAVERRGDLRETGPTLGAALKEQAAALLREGDYRLKR